MKQTLRQIIILAALIWLAIPARADNTDTLGETQTLVAAELNATVEAGYEMAKGLAEEDPYAGEYRRGATAALADAHAEIAMELERTADNGYELATDDMHMRYDMENAFDRELVAADEN